MSATCVHQSAAAHSRRQAVRVTPAGLILLIAVGSLSLVELAGNRVIQAAPSTTRPADVYSVWPFDAKEAAQRQNDTAKALGTPKILNITLGNGPAIRLVLIPAGTFIMGSPATERDNRAVFKDEVLHEVTISKPFYMGVTNVTVGQYAQFIKETGQPHKETGFRQTADHPVVQVSWEDAQAFCKWASKKTGKSVGLPTEAQWEYACRAGNQARFSFGDKIADLGDYSWYGVNSAGTTHPVGQKRPNAWGLYDMNGNAWQWCADYSGPYVLADKTDPAGPKAGKQRVLRGGSWISDGPANCRSAHRGGDAPVTSNPYYGFRVVVTLNPD